MSEGKTGKYLKYALGEILLVVIGILIALQINNWNEDRKDRVREKELLEQLQSEFQSNLEQLDEKIWLREGMIRASLNLLYYKDHKESRIQDSALSWIGTTVLGPTFDPIVNDISSSGRIQLLQNSTLKELLSRWTSEIVQVTEEEVAWLNYRQNQYTPELIKHRVLRNVMYQYWENYAVGGFQLDKGKKVKFELEKPEMPQTLPDLFDHSGFDQHLAMCASFAKLTNIQSESLRDRIVKILELISLEMDRFDQN